MNERLLCLIDKLSLPINERATRRILRDFARNAGFDYFAYLHMRGHESFGVSNYPQQWQDLYVQEAFFRTDPVITKAKHGPPVFTWSADEARRTGRKDIIRMLRAADEFGIRSGLCMSAPAGFKDRMLFTLATSALEPSIDTAIDPVIAAVAVSFIHLRLAKDDQDKSLAVGIVLSPREAECLRWFAEGMSMQDIALTVGVSYRSVRSYLDSATTKLGAANSRQASSIAIRLGLI